MRCATVVAISLLLAAASSAPAVAQQDQDPVHITPRVEPKYGPKKTADADKHIGNSESTAPAIAQPVAPDESSSRDTRIDIKPPKNEDDAYPDSDVSNDVNEVKPWDPHKAQKDIEVGDYYYKRGNYKGAFMRYDDALKWQDNNAEAMWKAGDSAEKLKMPDAAARYYAGYLKTLPNGDHAAQARQRLQALSK